MGNKKNIDEFLEDLETKEPLLKAWGDLIRLEEAVLEKIAIIEKELKELKNIVEELENEEVDIIKQIKELEDENERT